MTSYMIGNLLGRLLASYAIVWVVCLLAGRGQWKEAFRRSRRWYAVLGVLVLFLGGLAGTVGSEMPTWR